MTIYSLDILLSQFGTSYNVGAAAAAAKSLQLCPTLCVPIDGSPPGSPLPGILQARTLEWDAISFSNAYSGPLSFRMGWLDLLADQGAIESLLQPHSPKASILRRSAFFIVQL